MEIIVPNNSLVKREFILEETNIGRCYKYFSPS